MKFIAITFKQSRGYITIAFARLQEEAHGGSQAFSRPRQRRHLRDFLRVILPGDLGEEACGDSFNLRSNHIGWSPEFVGLETWIFLKENEEEIFECSGR